MLRRLSRYMCDVSSVPGIAFRVVLVHLIKMLLDVYLLSSVVIVSHYFCIDVLVLLLMEVVKSAVELVKALV